jgi:hypothetical protein
LLVTIRDDATLLEMTRKRMSAVNRSQTRLYRPLAETDDSGYMPGPPARGLAEVWELTRQAWAFFRESAAEQRLQRDVAVLI